MISAMEPQMISEAVKGFIGGGLLAVGSFSLRHGIFLRIFNSMNNQEVTNWAGLLVPYTSILLTLPYAAMALHYGDVSLAIGGATIAGLNALEILVQRSPSSFVEES